MKNADPNTTNIALLIEEGRKKHGMTRKRLAEIMRIKPRTYARKVEDDSFTTKEFVAAVERFNMRVVVIKNLEYMMIADPPLILADKRPEDLTVDMVPMHPGWRDKLQSKK